MTAISAPETFVSALATPSGARQTGELTRAFESLAEQALALAGAGGLLGLGVGITVSGAGVYLIKRRQIHNRLQS